MCWTRMHPWLYARVDGVERGGRLLLMELEMTEPSLFLAFDGEAPLRFVRAIERLTAAHRFRAPSHQRPSVTAITPAKINA